MRFHIKALSDSGGIVSLALEAADAADAGRQARARGCDVLSLRRAHDWPLKGLGGAGRFPLPLFNQELLALLGAGLMLVESIEALAEKEPNAATRATLERLTAQLRRGQSLSQAMQEQPGAFPALYVATVRATERSGDLPDALRRYVAYASQLEQVRRKAISASIYPALLVVAGSLVLLFLLGYVIPRFSLVYEDVQGELPLLSRGLLQLGTFISAHGPALALAGAGTLALLGWFLGKAQVQRWAVVQLQRIPAVGGRVRLYQLARYYRTLGMLLHGGTPMVTAMDMAAGLLGPALRAGAARARDAVREGLSISEAMSLHGLTTPVALRMLRVGERSGRMDEMMERTATFLDEDIARWVDWFTRLFEPLLMAAIGLAIGAIVVLMYLPVFELAGSLQ